MKFTYYGHSCFSVNFDGYELLFDPFIKGNPLAKDINIEEIKADYIFISHGHGDHIADAIELAKQTNALVIANAEIADWIISKGYSKVHPINYGSRVFDFGKMHFVPAQHSSGLPDGAYGGNPGGFVIKNEKNSFYYSGDTCLSMEMKLIPEYAKLDFAILPIGGNFTMDAEEAVLASNFIQCNQIIGVHYNTFGYIVIDQDAAKNAFAQVDKTLLLPQIGESLEIA